MKKYTFEQVVQLAENALARIKRSPENPYKNLKFVDKIFESASPSTRQDIKNLLRGNFKGHLQENVFSTPSPSKPQHLYNYLYENNMLSKYDELAEYMDFPSVTELQSEAEEYDNIDDIIWNPEQQIKMLGIPAEKYNIKRKELYLSPAEVKELEGGFRTALALKQLKRLDFKIMDAPMHRTEPEKTPSTPQISPSKPKKEPPYAGRGERIFTGSGPKIATDYYIDNNIKEEYDDDQYEYDENMRIEDEIEKIKQDMLDMPLGQTYIQGDDNIIELILIPNTEYEYDVLYQRESIGKMVVTAVDGEIQAIDFEAKSWNPLQESEGNVEYVIWGVPPNEEEEKLLLANLEGKPVTDIEVAKNFKSVLEKKHGCTNVRIQKVNLSDNDFSAFKKP